MNLETFPITQDDKKQIKHLKRSKAAANKKYQ